MDPQDLKIVSRVPIFRGLDEYTVRDIIGNAFPTNFGKGQIVFQQGENATSFYLVLSGWVKLFRQMPSGEQAILHIFKSGETFAEAAMFDSKTYPATAEAVSETRLLKISSANLKSKLADNSDVAMHMLASTTIHMKHLVAEIEQIKGRNSLERVAHFLLGFCAVEEPSHTFELPYEKNLIATRLGIKPESLSRLLNQLRGYGVHCEKNQIVVSNIPALKRLAMGEDPNPETGSAV